MGEVLGFDFETTGVDRFNDVPVSYALVTLMAGERVSTIVGSDRSRPGHSGRSDGGARNLDGTGAGGGHAAAGTRWR